MKPLSGVHQDRDRGTGAVEYVAVVLLIAVMVGGLIVSGVGGRVSGGICNALAEIVSARCTEPDAPPVVAVSHAPGPGGPSASPALSPEDHYRRLCRQLGLDCANWDPSRGLSCNDHNIVPVYEYYADLSRGHPELQWAGMAKLAGGLVYAGMQDLHVMRKLSGDVRERFLRQRFPDIPTVLLDALVSAGESELEYFEDKFVAMQKQIFRDLGWQHAAYASGGIEEMRRLSRAGQLPSGMIDAWEDIASGDPERIRRGNEELLYREQKIVLQDDYDEMKGHHAIVGLAVTYMLSYTAESPIPGGKPFREVVNRRYGTPERVCVPWTGWCQDVPSVGVRVPENIADFDSRWEWITEDMLPTYQRKLTDEQAAMRREIDRPLDERASDYRFIPVGYDPGDGVC